MLAAVLVHIDPVVVIRLVQQLRVMLAQRSQALLDHLEGFGVGQLHIEVVHDGHIQVVQMHLVHAQLLLAQLHILFHGGAHSFDAAEQVIIHRHRDTDRGEQ